MQWAYAGTHQHEDLFGVQPTGKYMQVPGIMEFRITVGKAIEERGIVDNLSLVTQLQGE